jgi:hypothetical protein
MPSLERHLKVKQRVLFIGGVILFVSIGWAVTSAVTRPATGSVIGAAEDQPARQLAGDDALRVSNLGSPTSVSAQAQHAVGRAQNAGRAAVGGVRLLGERDGSAFYRLLGATRDCYAAGLAGTGDFGVLACPDTFPSAEQPVLSFSTIEQLRGGAPHYMRVEGIAVDGVAAVELFSDNGETLTTVPVRANIFRLGSAPPSAVVGLRGVDEAGHVVYAERIPGR